MGWPVFAGPLTSKLAEWPFKKLRFIHCANDQLLPAAEAGDLRSEIGRRGAPLEMQGRSRSEWAVCFQNLAQARLKRDLKMQR
jgi:hypothetical protein